MEMIRKESPNAFGKTSSLSLTAARAGHKTCLRELSFRAPFKVMSPFEQEDGGIQVMVLTASAGILEGDVQEIEVRTEPGARMECISQSFEKIHKMDKGRARRNTSLHVGRDSLLLYRPLPAIPFAGSAFDSRTQIELEDKSSRLIYQEILYCGRAARGERFGFRHYNSLVEARQDGHLIYRENCRFSPEHLPMESVGFFEGYSHLASILLFHMDMDGGQKEEIRGRLEDREDMCGGITTTGSGDTVVRILGNQAQKLQELCDEICRLYINHNQLRRIIDTGQVI